MFLLDFETKSGCDIARGYDQYFRDPDADILCLVYGDENAEKPKRWWPGCSWVPDHDLFEWARGGGLIGASNAPFDQSAWEYIGVERYGFPEIPAESWYCTQAQTRVAGLPSKLEHAADAVKAKRRKSRRGAELIKLMSIPPFEHTLELLAEMVDYCESDWFVMREIFHATPLLSQDLFHAYQTNQIINDRGVRIDREMALAASQYADAERAEISEKLEYVTGGDVSKPTQHTRFKNWLLALFEEDDCADAVKLMARYTRAKKDDPKTGVKKGESVKKYSSDKSVRGNLLSDPVALGIDPVIVEALELMNDASGSATSKYAKMGLLADPLDDRVRGAIRAFGAASTLRFSSLGLQLHNFRRDSFNIDEVNHFRAQMLAGATLTDPETSDPVRVIDTLGKLLKGALIPKEGFLFISSDWGAVESRGTAWISRETRKLDLFRSGACPYCHAAENIYGRPIDKDRDPHERQVGKVLDLAAGFLGGPGALAAMASSYGLYIAEDERQTLIDNWRARHPRIVSFGDLLLKTAFRAMHNVGVWMKADRVAYLFDGSALYCRLPDGETLLRYPEARIDMVVPPWERDKDDPQKIPNITALKAAYTKAADETEWPRHSLWRGLLLENCVQAFCAILLREKIEIFKEWCVFHVHDQLILEVPIEMAEEMRARLQREMETSPQWCPGMPLVAEPKIMTRYGT